MKDALKTVFVMLTPADEREEDHWSRSAKDLFLLFYLHLVSKSERVGVSDFVRLVLEDEKPLKTLICDLRESNTDNPFLQDACSRYDNISEQELTEIVKVGIDLMVKVSVETRFRRNKISRAVDDFVK